MKWLGILAACLTVSYAQLESVTNFVSPVSQISEFTESSDSTSLNIDTTQDTSFHVNLLDTSFEDKSSNAPELSLTNLNKLDILVTTSEEPAKLERTNSVSGYFTENKLDSSSQASVGISSESIETNVTPILNRFASYDGKKNTINTEIPLISNQINDNVLEESKTVTSSLITSGIGQEYLNQPSTEDGRRLEKLITIPKGITNKEYSLQSTTGNPASTLIPASRPLYISSPNIQSPEPITALFTVTTLPPVSSHITTALPYASINPPIRATVSTYTAPTKSISSDRNAVIIHQDNIISGDGSYKHSFESSNGISIQAQGTSRTYDGNPPARAIVASGAFSWVDPNGKKIDVKYTADENGYHPESDAIPTTPPTPPEIARAVAWIRKVLSEKNIK